MPFPLSHVGLAVVLAAAAAVAACADADGPPGQCQVGEAAHLKLEHANGVVVAPAQINGTDVAVIVDTGSEKSVVTAGIANSLALLADPRHGTLVSGVGGQGRPQNDVLVDRFNFGGYDPGSSHYAIVDMRITTKSAPLGGIVGADVLSHFDLDLDLAHDRLTLYSVRHCSGRFLPWTGEYAAIPLDVDWNGMLKLPVKVDGKDMLAMLDTGASHTMLDSGAAERVGFAGASGGDKSGDGFGVAGVGFKLAIHQFHAIQVGSERLSDPQLTVLDRSLRNADMLLGFDYLRARHIWISYRTHQMFVAAKLP